MSSKPSISKEIQEKWGINPEDYEPWIKTKDLLEIFDYYKDRERLKSDTQLANILGVKPQAISQIRAKNKEKRMAHFAVKYLDRLEIDPTIILKRRKVEEPKNKTFTCEDRIFLDVFPDANRRADMIKYQRHINALIDDLNAIQKQNMEEGLESA